MKKKKLKSTYDLADRIIQTYSDWKINEYMFTNIKTGEFFWVANGVKYLKYNSAEILTSAQQRIIWSTIREAVILNAAKVDELNNVNGE